MKHIQEKVKSHWMDCSKLFDLDEDKYEEPVIKRIWYGLPHYDPRTDTMGFYRANLPRTIRHETRHKIDADCMKQILDGAIEDNNEKLLRFVADRMFEDKIYFTPESEMIKKDLCENRHNLKNRTREVSGILSNFDGMNYAESLAYSFDASGFRSNLGIGVSVAFPLFLAGMAISQPILSYQAFDKGGLLNYMVGAASIGGTLLTGYYGTMLTVNLNKMTIDIDDNIARMRSLHMVKPEVRKFHHLGPKKNEDIDSFASKLDSVGAFDI